MRIKLLLFHNSDKKEKKNGRTTKTLCLPESPCGCGSQLSGGEKRRGGERKSEKMEEEEEAAGGPS